jgi:hypothetical protein
MKTHYLFVLALCLSVRCLFFMQPSGLLAYLDSQDEVPVNETDRLHVRDNVKLAQVQLLLTTTRTRLVWLFYMMYDVTKKKMLLLLLLYILLYCSLFAFVEDHIQCML